MSKDRVKQYRLRQKELGRLKREMYLTDAEFKKLKERLTEIRSIPTDTNDRKIYSAIYLKLISDYGGHNDLKCGDVIKYVPWDHVWRGMTEQDRVSRGLYVNCGGMNLFECLKLNKDVVIHE